MYCTCTPTIAGHMCIYIQYSTARYIIIEHVNQAWPDLTAGPDRIWSCESSAGCLTDDPDPCHYVCMYIPRLGKYQSKLAKLPIYCICISCCRQGCNSNILYILCTQLMLDIYLYIRNICTPSAAIIEIYSTVRIQIYAVCLVDLTSPDLTIMIMVLRTHWRSMSMSVSVSVSKKGRVHSWKWREWQHADRYPAISWKY